MATCFVMQPFDGAAFDKRYESIFEPAIAAADLEAYRVDKDPGTSIPIDDIERGIREARLCLADITLDNPNVWFELGYAIACKKEVVLVCSDERTTTKFPFDIHHRTIIKYGTKSPQDYDQLRDAITRKIEAYVKKTETLQAVAEESPVAKIEGLDHHEVVCLATIAANLTHPNGRVSSWVIKNDMETSGSTKVAASIAMAGLVAKSMVDTNEERDFDGAPYIAFGLTPSGWNWVFANKDRFHLRREPKGASKGGPPGDFDDDIPF